MYCHASLCPTSDLPLVSSVGYFFSCLHFNSSTYQLLGSKLVRCDTLIEHCKLAANSVDLLSGISQTSLRFSTLIMHRMIPSTRFRLLFSTSFFPLGVNLKLTSLTYACAPALPLMHLISLQTCNSVDNAVFAGTNLANCQFLASDIETCQAKGKIGSII